VCGPFQSDSSDWKAARFSIPDSEGPTMSYRIMGLGSLIACMLFLVVAPRPIRAADDAFTFEIFQDKEKEYRWRLKQGEDIIATAGQGYKEKASCKKGIESIKKGLANDKDKFEIYEDKAKAFRWRIKASNGQTVAAANKGYKDKAECEKVVEQIKKGVAKAEIVEK
jgi:uncharacterized protein YegP (UPF0339 family)